MPAPTQITAVLTSHNARIAHIRKFCALPPERGRVLRLVTIEDPPQALCEWSRDVAENSATVPADVDQALQEHATVQRGQVKATLAWLDEDGGMVVSKKLTAHYAPADDATETAAALDGSERVGLQQQQQLLDKHARLYINAHQTQVAQLTGLVRDLGGMLSESHRQAHMAHLELDKQRLAYRRELERMVDAELPPGTVEGEEREAIIQQVAGSLGQALPFILQGLMARFMGGAAAAPANTNAQPAAGAPAAPKAVAPGAAPAAALPAAAAPPAAPKGPAG